MTPVVMALVLCIQEAPGSSLGLETS